MNKIILIVGAVVVLAAAGGFFYLENAEAPMAEVNQAQNLNQPAEEANVNQKLGGNMGEYDQVVSANVASETLANANTNANVNAHAEPTEITQTAAGQVIRNNQDGYELMVPNEWIIKENQEADKINFFISNENVDSVFDFSSEGFYLTVSVEKTDDSLADYVMKQNQNNIKGATINPYKSYKNRNGLNVLEQDIDYNTTIDPSNGGYSKEFYIKNDEKIISIITFSFEKDNLENILITNLIDSIK